MLIAVELIFVLVLCAILVVFLKVDGNFLKSKLRKARVEEYWNGKDRRKYPRFEVSLEVAYSIVKRDAVSQANAKTIDISEGGARLILDEKLSTGTLMNLKFVLADSGQSIEIMGKVVWTEDAIHITDPSGRRFFYSGIKFDSTKESCNRLTEYIRAIADKRSKAQTVNGKS